MLGLCRFFYNINGLSYRYNLYTKTNINSGSARTARVLRKSVICLAVSQNCLRLLPLVLMTCIYVNGPIQCMLGVWKSRTWDQKMGLSDQNFKQKKITTTFIKLPMKYILSNEKKCQLDQIDYTESISFQINHQNRFTQLDVFR